jgi:hypothetical protein
MVGITMASPMPTRARIKRMGHASIGNSAAQAGVAHVASDQTTTPQARTCLGEMQETKRPAGRMARPYPTLNREEMAPEVVSVK